MGGKKKRVRTLASSSENPPPPLLKNFHDLSVYTNPLSPPSSSTPSPSPSVNSFFHFFLSIIHLEVGGLVLMAGTATREVGQQVKAELPIGLGVSNGLALCGRQRVLSVALLVRKAPRLIAAQNKGGDTRIEHAGQHTELEGAMAVAHSLELLGHPRLFHVLPVRRWLNRGLSGTGREREREKVSE